MVLGLLVVEIWDEVRDLFMYFEIEWEVKVRVLNVFCEEEKIFLERWKKVIVFVLVKYLGLKEEDIYFDDVFIVVICGLGGGLRVLVVGIGFFLVFIEDGLFDCVMYVLGVFGLCWF